MISLSDQQLDTVMTAAKSIEPSRRSVFLERVAAMLKLRYRFTDGDVREILRWPCAAWCNKQPTPRPNPRNI